jgi:hypothetical protein
LAGQASKWDLANSNHNPKGELAPSQHKVDQPEWSVRWSQIHKVKDNRLDSRPDKVLLLDLKMRLLEPKMGAE